MAPRAPLATLLTVGLLLAACNDPADRYQPPAPGGGSAGSPPPPTGPGPDGQGPPPGENPDDQGGTPGIAPAGDGGCSASAVSLENLPIPEGKGVTLSGRIEGSGSGPALIEVVRLDGGRPTGIYNFVCPGIGSFELLAPPSLGEVYLVTFIDEGGDGPSADDVAGTTAAIEVAKQDISGITIKVSAGADLGKVALPHQAAWGPPPPSDTEATPPQGEGVAPSEGPPPEGTPPEGAPPEGEPADAPPPGGAPADAPPPEGAPAGG